MILKIILVTTLFGISFSKVREELWNDFKEVMISEMRLKESTMDSVEMILKGDAFADLDVEKIIGNGAFGIVFSAKNAKKNVLSIKIELDKHEKFKQCSFFKQIEADLKDRKYMVKIHEIRKITLPRRTMKTPDKIEDMVIPEEYFCVLIMETGNPASGFFFPESKSSLTREMKKENSKKMVRFMARLLEAYKILNFEAGYYHFDVKPDNLLYVITIADGEYEPRIIDFDHTFQSTDYLNHPDYIGYSEDYRPPELQKFMDHGLLSERTRIREIAEELYREYRFSEDFKEEAYAVGKTILKILEFNHEYLDPNDKGLENIKDIAQRMIVDDRDQRLSTRDAYLLAERYLKKQNILI